MVGWTTASSLAAAGEATTPQKQMKQKQSSTNASGGGFVTASSMIARKEESAAGQAKSDSRTGGFVTASSLACKEEKVADRAHEKEGASCANGGGGGFVTASSMIARKTNDAADQAKEGAYTPQTASPRPLTAKKDLNTAHTSRFLPPAKKHKPSFHSPKPSSEHRGGGAVAAGSRAQPTSAVRVVKTSRKRAIPLDDDEALDLIPQNAHKRAYRDDGEDEDVEMQDSTRKSDMTMRELKALLNRERKFQLVRQSDTDVYDAEKEVARLETSRAGLKQGTVIHLIARIYAVTSAWGCGIAAGEGKLTSYH